MKSFTLGFAGLAILMGSTQAAPLFPPALTNPHSNEAVSVTRTQFGIAHVKAHSLYGLGYGNAYAQAQDHSCLLADGYLRLRGERAQYLGAHRNEGDNYFLMSDIGYRILDLPGRATQQYSSLSASTRALAEGFAAGYNQYLEEVAAGNAQLDEICRDAPWVKPITAQDVIANVLLMGVQGSVGRLLPQLVQAGPDSETTPAQQSYSMTLTPAEQLTQGSNGWAIGKALSHNGRGMVLANPHFPFNGNFRFWTHHATVPGELDVMGASVLGMPGVVNIGFNRNLAWTHTYSTALHHVFYELTLDPDNPRRYRYKGQWHTMRERHIQVPVKTATGMQTHTHTAYATQFGLMLEDPERFPWQGGVAYAVSDVNLDNFSAIDHWLSYNRAASVAQLREASRRFNGLSFNNTLAADKYGNAFYTDDSNVPNLSAAALHWLQTDPKSAAIFAATGQVVLPGDREEMMFDGAVELAEAPSLSRRDYVQNSNDSFWLSNASQPLRNVSPLYGPVDVQQTERSRYAYALLRSGSGRDGRFNLDELEHIMLGNGSYFASERGVIAGLCQQYAGQRWALNEQLEVDVDPVCAAFAQWDGRFDLTSKAAHLAREFFRVLDRRQDFVVPFNPRFPTTTPHTIKSDPEILKKLLRAAADLQHYGFALDAPFAEIQYMQKGTERLSWAGPEHQSGGFNVFATHNTMDLTSFAAQPSAPLTSVVDGRPLWSGLREAGYGVNFGSSWMMVVGFDDNGPVARGLLSYSQSANRDSEHFSDSSRHYSAQQGLVELPFYPWQVSINKLSTTKLIVKKD
ncbi:peptidase S45 [Pseudoalteromonas rubra]|uniref:Peptidase S45 n=1 Tax=Pseudoalteromonas rubra TaxID=43658 RepID=A0A5S3UTS7_9GAMM|nr:penicillin acylase family protein [Pseudoalteromonas rubra]QPB84827.1 peptidase S45 [Pseudoalteromonas rubra]